MILLVHAAATLFMTGLIWFVQIVHYPLYDRVGSREFPRYETDHAALTTLVVGPVMLVELVSAGALLVFRPAAVSPVAVWAGGVLLGVIWFSTAFLQIPAHAILSAAYDAEAHRQLVSTNWIRTAAWTLRSLLVLWMLARAMD